MPPLHELPIFVDAPWLTWAVPAALLVTGALLMGPALRRRLAPFRLHRRLSKLGDEVLRSVLLDDGMDGKTWIDYLILRPEGVLMLELKPYRGIIFAAAGIDQWTQVVGTRSFKFPNPLHKHETDLLAVKGAAPGVPVIGRLVFTGGSEFPKGIPDGVASLDGLFAEFDSPAPRPVGEDLRAAWTQLKQAAVPVRGGVPAGVPLDAAPSRPRGMRLGLVFFGLAFAWLAWRFAA